MKYLKKVFDWFFQAYEPEKPKFIPKVMFKKNGKTYYLRKRKKNASSKSKRG
jgi:hypothetical protein